MAGRVERGLEGPRCLQGRGKDWRAALAGRGGAGRGVEDPEVVEEPGTAARGRTGAASWVPALSRWQTRGW